MAIGSEAFVSVDDKFLDFAGKVFPSVEERIWVPPCLDDDTVKVNHHDDTDDDAMDTSDDAKKFKNRLSDADLDKFLIVSRSVGTFARALDCSSSVKQPRYSITTDRVKKTAKL